jgi:AraC-like DNA-binding protein
VGVPLRAWVASADGRRWSLYRAFAPGPEIAAAVAGSWYGRPGWARTLRVLPDGCADLVWNGDGLAVVAAKVAPVWHELTTADWTVGVRLRCGTAGSLLGQAMSELPAGMTPLNELWPEARRAEEELVSCRSPRAGRAVLEALVAERLRRGVDLNRSAVAAANGLRVPGAKMGVLAGKLGISDRGLRRHLRHEVGYGPKELHRVLRFQSFLGRFEALAEARTSLATVAAELGYADQSHLGRDCRSLSGSSPMALFGKWQHGRKVPDSAGAHRPESSP